MLSVAELRRVVQALSEPVEQRTRRLEWSHFRRLHQAGARRCHQERRARQTPFVPVSVPLEPIRLLGLPILTDEHWEQLRPFLPPQKSPIGRPAVDHRKIVEGLVFVMRTGCPWRAVPERFGHGPSLVDRYQRWQKEGRWESILQCLLQEVPLSSSA